MRLLLTLILVFSASSAWSAPSITGVTGTVSDGETITISGSSFGTKSPAAPLLWDTFESGVIDNAIQSVSATIGAWETGSGSDNVFYSDTTAYAGSKAARHNFTGSLYNSSLSLNDTFSTVYVDFKRYLPDTGTSGNYKPFRYYGDSDTMEYFTGFGCSGGSPYGVSTISHNTGGTLSNTEWHGTPTGGRWNHYQLIFKESTPNTSDGTIIQSLNGVNYGWNTTAQETRNTTASLDQLRIGHYMSVGTRDGCTIPDPTYLYTDNVYIDKTWARVEIGNASTYAASTHREIQIPSTWSASSVEVTVNQGTFSSAETVYLYVFDENNAYNSAGYAVEIGGDGSGGETPAAATGALFQSGANKVIGTGSNLLIQ